MNERYNFILIVDINAETFRATNKRRLGKTYPTFYPFSLRRCCGTQVRNEIGRIRLIWLDNIFLSKLTFENIEHVVRASSSFPVIPDRWRQLVHKTVMALSACFYSFSFLSVLYWSYTICAPSFIKNLRPFTWRDNAKISRLPRRTSTNPNAFQWPGRNSKIIQRQCSKSTSIKEVFKPDLEAFWSVERAC